VTRSARAELELRQRRWADGAGVDYDARGFVRELGANLRRSPEEALRRELDRGSELAPRRHEPPRMHSLWSSAALVVNVFEYWRGRDASPLVAALSSRAEHAVLEFEAPLETGLPGDPPTSDVVLRLASGASVAVESKYSEWLVRRRSVVGRFKTKYFPVGRAVWSEAGLDACQALAADIQAGQERFQWLNATQLLKHALGLARTGRGFELVYLYYDWPAGSAATHLGELERFKARVTPEIVFRAVTYQALFETLATGAVDAGYVGYLRGRYFPPR